MRMVNRTALFGWILALLWCSGLAAFTALVLAAGPPDGLSAESTALFLAVFWLGGVFLVRHVASRPLVRVVVEADGAVDIVWRWPHARLHRRFAPGRLAGPVLLETCDDDGAPYAVVRLVPPGLPTADLAEGHDVAAMAAVRDDLACAMGGQGRVAGEMPATGS